MVIIKYLFPVYNKPTIYLLFYILIWAGIREILIISTPRFEYPVNNSGQFGINLRYKVHHSPDGLAQASTLGETFIKDDA